MKTIQLTQGKVALVDDEDFEYLNQWKWCAVKIGYKFYAKNKRIIMHRMIMNTPKGMDVDHIDGDGLNNQRVNLRNCTRSQNTSNSIKRCILTSKYKGVSRNRGVYFMAYICHNNKNYNLGRFKTEIDAAKAYDQAAIKYFGEFANLNFNTKK